ncbi:oxidoreductase [Gordonibacter pamelaeae]|uniref:oxidoreductase n=1 Tax=Gordonibacter pamelaeae TaxID=471189 RepID=UPI002666C56C|nr:oxidoreductase [Gordonibacter pamelaeae]
MMGVEKALLIDYEYCLGCSECETACLAAHGSGPEALGIKVTKLGPWKTRDGSWQYDFVPIPTDWCDLCEERTDRGSRPACARRCRCGAITYGTVDELAALFKGKSKMLLFSPKSSDRR